MGNQSRKTFVPTQSITGIVWVTRVLLDCRVRRLRRQGTAALEHAQDPVGCTGGGEVLESVSADGVAEGRENRLVVGFENLG